MVSYSETTTTLELDEVEVGSLDVRADRLATRLINSAVRPNCKPMLHQLKEGSANIAGTKRSDET